MRFSFSVDEKFMYFLLHVRFQDPPKSAVAIDVKHDGKPEKKTVRNEQGHV